MATPIDVVGLKKNKCRKKISYGKSMKSCVIRMTKKQQNFGFLSNYRAQSLPEPAPNIWLTLFRISSKSVHFRQSYSRTRQHRSFAPVEYFQIIGSSSP